MANKILKHKFVIFLVVLFILPFFSLIKAKTIAGRYTYFYRGETLAEIIEIDIFGGGFITICENDELGVKYDKSHITWKTKPDDNRYPQDLWRIDIRWTNASGNHQLQLDIDPGYSCLSDRGISSIYSEQRVYRK